MQRIGSEMLTLLLAKSAFMRRVKNAGWSTLPFAIEACMCRVESVHVRRQYWLCAVKGDPSCYKRYHAGSDIEVVTRRLEGTILFRE